MSEQHYCPHCTRRCHREKRYIECYHCHQRFYHSCYDNWFGDIDPTDFCCHRCQIQHLTELVEQLELGREPLTSPPPTSSPPPPPPSPPSPEASEAASPAEEAAEEAAVPAAEEAEASSPPAVAATPPRRQSPPPREPTPTTPPRLPHHERYYSIFDKHK